MDIQIVGQDYIGGVHEIHENREILLRGNDGVESERKALQ